MNLLFPIFYKQYGICKSTQLLMPRVFSLDIFQFPRDSIYHHIGYNTTELMPDPQDPVFHFETKKKIAVDYVTQLSETQGAPRHVNAQIINFTKPFHFKNRQFKYVKEPAKVVTDSGMLEVYSYGLLNEFYKYPQNKLSQFHHDRNIQATVWTKINELIEVSDRYHFITLKVPDVLPSVRTLQMYSGNSGTQIINFFDTPDKLLILELWKWLDEVHRASSMISKIKEEHLHRINIIMEHSGKWAVMNLAYLNSWRKGSKPVPGMKLGTQWEPFDLQKYALRNIIQIQSAQVVVTDEEGEPVINGDEENLTETDTIDDITDPDGQTGDPITAPQRDDKDMLPQNDASALDQDLDVSEEIDAQIDEELKILETIEKQNLLQKASRAIPTDDNDDDLDIRHDYAAILTKDITPEEQAALTEVVFKERDPNETLLNEIEKYADYGVMSAADYRGTVKAAQQITRIHNEMTGGKNLTDFAVVTKEELSLSKEKTQLADIDNVQDKSMFKSTLKSYDADYVKNVMHKDIAAMIVNIQAAGIIVQGYDVESQRSILGEYETHTLQIKPIDGVSSTIRFRLPKVDQDGYYSVSGNKCRLRKQRGEIPIRKTSPYDVKLTSYYNSLFIQRSQKKSNDCYDWLYRTIRSISQQEGSKHITKVDPANVFDNSFKAPRVYSGLARYMKGMVVDGNRFIFDRKDRLKIITDPESLAKLENYGGQGKFVLSGVSKFKEPIVVDHSDEFYVWRNNQMVSLGNIFKITMISQADAPLDSADVKIYGKSVPLGIALGYKMGLTNLIRMLKVKPLVFDAKQRIPHSDDQYMIVFKDKKLVFSRKDTVATLILSGFSQYKNSIKNYFIEAFDDPNVYLNVLQSAGITVRILREVDMMDQLFVDPITKDILRDMKEPMTFLGLLFRSAELLTMDYHPDSQDMRYMRIKGYERFAGAIYTELVNSIKDFKSKSVRNKSKIEMSPYAVWKNITTDPAAQLVEDINPIQNLKEQEVVTYVGNGGRSKETMNKPTRAYHQSDMGVISESTPDSGDVGVTTYLSPNAQIGDLRGMPVLDKELAPASILSTAALLAPGAVHDDAKRVNFIGIQQKHTIACDSYHQPYVRTGYEQVIAQRTTDMFAYCAQEDGKVISVNEKGVVVEYVSGEQKGVLLGRQYGKAEGSVYPHDIVPMVRENQTFKKGQPIAYNQGFFEPDNLNPGNIIWKSSRTVKTALLESSQTHEDSSSVSRSLSGLLSARTTKMRSFVVDFHQGIRNMLKPGTVLDPTDVLFIIEDEITNDLGLFDAETISTLKKLSNKAPKAKVKGVLDKIEVYYHGDKDDMSTSLRALATMSDKNLSESLKAIGKKGLTGSVTDEYRVDGTPLALDQAEIKLYITVEGDTGVGDKIVVANQLKSVVGEVMDYDMTTEKGEAIELVFGGRSVGNRIVESPMIIGTTTTLLKALAKQAVSVYRGIGKQR